MSRVDRPYTRRPGLISKSRRAAGSLASSAGLAERPSIDALERRQLLFSLTITADDVDPNTGIGTVRQYFGYVPQRMGLLQDLEDPQPPQQRTEDFNDEGIGAVGSGAFFLESNIRVLHNMVPGRDVRIGTDDPQNPPTERYLFADMRRANDTLTFELWNEGDTLLNKTPATGVTFTVVGDGPNDPTGFFTDQTVIELVLGNQVTQTFTGTALRNAFQPGSLPLQGIGTVTLAGTQAAPAFDSVRIKLLSNVSTGIPAFRIDNLAFSVSQPRFAGNINVDLGAVAVLSGPVGATATFLDLYGRDIPTSSMQIGDTIVADFNDDGIPDAGRDGIGSIHMINTDSRTSLTVFGTTIEYFTPGDDPPDDADFVDFGGGAAYKIVESLTGNYGDFERAGFGYVYSTQQNQTTYGGLPPGPGSVIIGSPYVRPQNNWNPGGFAPQVAGQGNVGTVNGGFTNPNQGIFVEGGASIGSVYIHGILHGSSVFSGAVDKIYVGSLPGSVTVKGDLGSLTVGTDAGMWAPEPGFGNGAQLNNAYDTGGQLLVERSVGRIDIAARSLMDVTVIGDLNAPSTRPPHDAFTFYESEFPYSIQQGDDADIIDAILNSSDYVARQPSQRFRTTDQAPIYAGGTYRNDTIMGAEFINSVGSGARIVGDLSGRDPANGEDTADVYAFAVDGTSEVVFDVVGNVALARVVDSEGRTLAAPSLGGTAERVRYSGQFKFQPNSPGIYYLVLTDGNLGDTGSGSSGYSVAVTGLAPVTLGSMRTGASLGFGALAPTITVLTGDLGVLRVGTGIVAGDGADASPLAIVNNRNGLNADDALSFAGATVSVSGNLFGLIAGSDIGVSPTDDASGAVRFVVGGNFGTMRTGQSPVAGRSVNDGDVNFMSLSVGGAIASIDVQGGIGMDQDNTTDPRASISGADSFVITTGTAGGHGDIGLVRVGFSISGDAFHVVTSPGSTVGAFLVAQDPGEYASALAVLRAGDDQPDEIRFGIYGGLRGIPFTSSLGSSVRFVDAPRLDLINSFNVRTDLFGDTPVEFVDDSGARARISIEGASTDAVGQIVSLPIDGSQGVAVSLIDVDLSNGRTLSIQGIGAGAFQIGRIRVTNADANSRIVISGGVEIDVYRIDMEGGGTLFELINSTPGGDIVAADLNALGTLRIEGNLGRTQMPAWAPKLIGPELGLEAGLQGQVGGAIGFANIDGFIDPDFGGDTWRPLGDDTALAGQAYLDDIGSPVGFQLNGLIVRTGDVAEINVKGAIGDAMLQGDGATLTAIVANSDGVTQFGAFDGIVGSVYAANIADIDIGDGIARSNEGPIQSAGVFAVDDIIRVRSSINGATIRGAIVAANADDQPGIDGEVQGVNEVTLNNGLFDGAFIGSTNIDGFFSGLLYGEANLNTGDIGNLVGNNSNFFRSAVRALNAQNIRFTNAYFDASSIGLSGRAENISFKGARNSTLLGGALELHANVISTAGDLVNVTATDDIEDLVIDVTGSAVGGITARNIARSSLDIDNILTNVSVRGSIRATSVVAGRVVNFNVADSIESSTFAISGPVQTVSAGVRIANTSFEVTGPDGSINSITARDLVSGRFSVSGPIQSITSTLGDLRAVITTTTSRGDVGTLRAGRDVDVFADISGNLSNISAGRNIGSATNKGVILARGNLTSATASTGQLYNDLRSGGTIGSVSVARVVSKPGNDLLGSGSVIAFGRIGSVNVQGDFNGNVISYSGGIGSVAITNGSLLPGRTVSAFAGNLESLTITNGNLLGSAISDFDITSLRVTGAADGVFGDVGINPGSSQFTSYDAFRNQLPVGVGANSTLQGARIAAGRNLVSVSIAGSVYESVIQAGRAIKNVTVSGSVGNDGLTAGFGSAFVAGDTIDLITITGNVDLTQFIAGVTSLGSDNRAGGLGAAADTVKSGTITRVNVGGSATNTRFLAGVTPGLDGQYGSSDDRVALGTSSINALSLGSASNVLAESDSLATSVANDGRLIRTTNLTSVDPLIDSGLGTPGVGVVSGQAISFGGGTITFNVSGPGQAFFDTGTGRLTLRNTTSATSVTVSSSLSSLNNFSIVTNDDAALSSLRVNPALTGVSQIVVDSGIGTLTLGAFSGTGRVSVGGDVASATFASFAGGSFSSNVLTSLTITGDFGVANAATRPQISALSIGTMAFRGAMRGIVSSDRDVTGITITGVADRASVRAGARINSFTAPSTNQSTIAAGEALGSVSIQGNATDTSFLAGVDLGSDAAFGGTGTALDKVTSGSISSVTVTGNFQESDVIAGYLRGVDGFFGTGDDTVAPGLSSIGTVNISGTLVGSTRGSESYRVASSGDISSVRVGGQVVNTPRGNFAVEAARGILAPTDLRPVDIIVSNESGQYVARMIFNQPIDASSFKSGLSVSEVRGSSDVSIRLIEGLDYTLSFDAAANTALVRFSREITNRNLPQVPGLPGPGVYRFELDQGIVRGKSQGAKIDGNGDGFSVAGDDFVGHAVVGDAGDKLQAEVITAGTGATATRVDLFGPASLDFVFDDPANADGLPDANKTFVVRGSIGDHPDNDAANFSFADDADLYSITLRAGQILQLSALRGSAADAGLTLVDPSGNIVNQFQTNGQGFLGLDTQASATPLPTNEAFIAQRFVAGSAYLIKTTGTYRLVVGQTGTFNQAGQIPNPDDAVGTGVIGTYDFDVSIFDDGDSGFTSDTDSGNGAAVVTAPEAIAFAGADLQFNTSDDISSIVVAGYTFTLSAGADNAVGTSDDVVSGVNAAGDTSTRVGGRTESVVNSAIGPAAHSGVPGSITADADIFHLNNRAAIAAGTRIRVTVKLTETGSNLGSAQFVGNITSSIEVPADQSGFVAFGLFETTDSQTVDDAKLVFSPSDFRPFGGPANTVIANNGVNSYGYDANGDFYIDFVTPDSVVVPGQAGTFALYVQGVFNADYKLDIVSEGSGALPLQSQNFLIETGGGTVDWLQAGGLTTTMAPFSAATVGFRGFVNNNQNADEYILSNLVDQLNSLYQSAGFSVRFSTNPADFEFQPFSTIFLSSSVDPINSLFESFDFTDRIPLPGQAQQNTPVFSTQPFGFSEHSDPFNTDLNDEAVVYAPSFALLGLTPSLQDVDVFVDSLTGATARRAGELLGLRMNTDDTVTNPTFDFQASNSPQVNSGFQRNFAFPGAARQLSSNFDSIGDTNFFVGRQNTRSLLDKILARV